MAVPVLITTGRKASFSQGVNATSITIDTPSGIQPGDLLIAFISLQPLAASANSLQVPAGWTRIDRYTSGIRCVGVAIKPLRTTADVIAQPVNQTWVNGDGGATSRYSGAIYRITGANLDAPLDGQAGSWAPDHSASTGDLITPLTNVPSSDSLGLGMFYAHTASGSAAPVVAGSHVIEQFTATDASTQATSTHATFTVNNPSRSTRLALTSGTYTSGSAMQLSIASANPVMPALGLYRIGYTSHSLTAVAASITLTAHTSMQVGDWALASVVISAPATSDSIDTPPGWTLLFYEGTGSGTYKTYHFTKQITDGVRDFNFALSSGSVNRGLMASLMWLRGCAPPSKWIVGAMRRRNGTVGEQTSVYAPGIVTVKPDTLVLSFGVERTTAYETAITSVSGEASEWFFVEQRTSASLASTTLWWGSQDVASPRSTVDTIVTYPNPQTLNGWGMQIGIPGLQASGYATKYWNGASVGDAQVYIQGASSLITPDIIRVVPNPHHTVAKMLTEVPFYWSHRGGGDNWPEMTMHAYTQSILWGAKCFEVSVQRTLDGVWVGSHDVDTFRMTGQNMTIPTSTWAQIEGLTSSASATDMPAQSRQPLMKLVDLLERYAQSHVIIVDNKQVVDMTAFLDLLEQYDPTHEHIIFKGYRGSVMAPNMARARGFKTWGYMYDDDAVDAGIDLSCWDILGLNYNATQVNWTAIKSHGKPVVAHIINSSAAAATAIAKGADGLQCSNVKQVIPYSI